ncbi:DUF565 domain-containing protein [Cyanobium sp. WAJ14-Wanaka]|nr:DUF565 domain-containing protein [Cyanobium sp. WAJ14-Wanaka]
MQPTRFQQLTTLLGERLLGNLQGSWRFRSGVLLALLLGSYLGNNLTAWLLPYFPGGRPFLVLALVLAIELIVRLRGRLVGRSPAVGWILCDNFRIGFVYSVVLEAFKLGS